MELEITGYDEVTSRKDPKGFHVTYDIHGDAPIVSLAFWMEDGSATLEASYPVKQGCDGRYFRGLNFKPVTTGSYHFNLRVRDDQGREAEVRSAGPVEVTEDPVEHL